MKKAILVIFISIIALTVYGCSNSEKTTSDKNQTAKVETGVNKTTGNDKITDSNKDAEGVRRQGLTGEPLPENFPSDIPLPEGEIIDAWPSLYENDVKGFDITMVPQDDYLEVKDFYDAAFEEIIESNVNEKSKNVFMKGIIGDYEIEVSVGVGDEEFGASLMLMIKERN